MEIKPVPTETIRLAAHGMQREVEKVNRIVEVGKRTLAPQMEAVIRALSRL